MGIGMREWEQEKDVEKVKVNKHSSALNVPTLYDAQSAQRPQSAPRAQRAQSALKAQTAQSAESA